MLSFLCRTKMIQISSVHCIFALNKSWTFYILLQPEIIKLLAYFVDVKILFICPSIVNFRNDVQFPQFDGVWLKVHPLKLLKVFSPNKAFLRIETFFLSFFNSPDLDLTIFKLLKLTFVWSLKQKGTFTWKSIKCNVISPLMWSFFKCLDRSCGITNLHQISAFSVNSLNFRCQFDTYDVIYHQRLRPHSLSSSEASWRDLIKSGFSNSERVPWASRDVFASLSHLR